jgi:hypothetical protein
MEKESKRICDKRICDADEVRFLRRRHPEPGTVRLRQDLAWTLRDALYTVRDPSLRLKSGCARRQKRNIVSRRLSSRTAA